jgi:outer membrane protein assembly factor BamB
MKAASKPRPWLLWPGIAGVTLLFLLRYGLPAVAPDAILYGMGGAALCVVAVAVWWLGFSRAPHLERWAVLVLLAVALMLTWRYTHVSIRTGQMGFAFPLYATPTACLALVVWAAIARNREPRARWVTLSLTTLLLCGGWLTVRTEGMMGQGSSQFAWRWTKSAEDRLLARKESELPPRTGTPPAAPAIAAEPVRAATVREEAEPVFSVQWAGFRGPLRDGVVRGAGIRADWTSTPPAELWRRPVGPGWGSFAAGGGLIYTQEQQGEDEIVACYRLADGAPVWVHKDRTRFWESNGGAGPRGTPLLHEGRVYALGATGILNVLDARDGSVVWSRNAAADSGAKLPEWGYSASPLVTGEQLIVATSGHLAAYDRARGGKPLWIVDAGGGGYSSPHRVTLDGVEQIVLLSGSGLASVAPADGTILWRHAWEGSAILQPVALDNGDVLLATADATGGRGTRRLAVTQKDRRWSVEEKWTSRGLKPYFNDLVVHGGFAYGFDGAILSCIDLADGRRRWKGGRYGYGQAILLAELDLLLVLAETGEVALVAAKPDGFSEIGKFKAIEGKTWNHPALAGEILLVRNGEEMAAFRVARRGS